MAKAAGLLPFYALGLGVVVAAVIWRRVAGGQIVVANGLVRRWFVFGLGVGPACLGTV